MCLSLLARHVRFLHLFTVRGLWFVALPRSGWDQPRAQGFNILSRLVIAFLPRSKNLLISWMQSPSAVILEPKKIKSVTVSIVSPSICHEVMGPDAMNLVF